MGEQRADLGPDGHAEAGLPGDPDLFKALSEINMIAHLADTAFARLLPQGVTPAQFGVLNRLVRLRRRETVSMLAAAFQVSQPTMSSTVKRLIANGLARLEPDPADRRARFVVITPAGQALRDDAVACVTPEFEALAAQAPDMDFAALLRQLNRLRTYLDERR